VSYRVLIFDGRNALHRAAHVAKPLTTTIDGVETPIGGVYQFLRIVLSEVEKHGDDAGCAVFVAWEGDNDGRSWRRDLFPEYKSGRDPNRHAGDMGRQEKLLRALLTDLGWSQVWSPSFEADDTIATLAAHFERHAVHRCPVGIVTGDRDLHQCVTTQVHVLDGKKLWTRSDVREKWGVHPSRIPDIKALAGDKSDGFGGVAGIGEKWAREMIAGTESLDALFSLARTSPAECSRKGWTASLTAKLLAGEQDAYLCRQLATCRTDAPLEFAARASTPAREVFERLRFSSLLAPSTLRTADALAGR
jgi:DNA polymerase-1